jgi:molybdopterin/thiamine biosynthesis adenylyltransferase
MPGEGAPDCATAGVAGPVCGVAGALAADRALAVLRGSRSVYGAIVTYDGRRDLLRSVAVGARRGCPLCSDARVLRDIDPRRYQPRSCEV